MRRTRIFVAAIVTAAVLLTMPAFASQSSGITNMEAQASSPMVDVLIYRPFGMLGLVASTALFVPAELITLVVQPKSWREPVDAFLVGPAKFVFVDPIGTH